MSGHNPHGRLGQPNPPWNHLQVPSYVPRHPQLAHMSNERPMVQSPLTWHTPTHTDAALYNYMTAATHKTPLDINPLLSPAFVRAPVMAPFGSVDLSIPSSARHNTSSPRNITPPVGTNLSPPLDFNSQNINKTVSASSIGVIQTTASAKEKLQSSNTSNGDVLHTAPITGLYVRDARQINNDIVKLSSREPVGLPSLSEPIELVKEAIYNTLKNHAESLSTNQKSPERLLSLQNLVPALLLPSPSINSSINNNIVPDNHQSSSTSNSCQENIFPKDQTSTSNDDSLDSNNSKRRRRRKPNKTTRMSSTDNDDDSLRSNNNKRLCIDDIDTIESTAPVLLSASKIMDNSIEHRNTLITPIPENISVKQNQEVCVTPSLELSGITNIEESNVAASVVSPIENKITEIPENIGEKIESPKNLPSSPTKSSEIDSRLKNDNAESTIPTENNCINSEISSPPRPAKRKNESDDCETIDKIAAMIASTSPECTNEDNNSQSIPQDVTNDSQIENGTDCLKEILDISQDIVEQKDNSFEEVENKLEEMFAGIEDDRPFILPSIDGSETHKTEDEKTTVLATLKTPIKDENKIVKKSTPTTTAKIEEPQIKNKKIVKKVGNKNKKVIVKKNLKPIKNINEKKSKIKDEAIPANDTVLKYKGPYVQMKTEGTFTIINAPISEEVAENKAKIKKSFTSQNNNDRTKIRGLHVSTLSMKYDADTTDKTWICVFCKMGPHKYGLGDLFGPYIITTSSEDYLINQIDPNNDEFKSKRTKMDMIQKRGLPVGIASSSTAHTKKKRKISEVQTSSNPTTVQVTSNDFDIFFGMTKATDDSYEVWMHGDCAVWSSGVHIIGTRIIGLEAAVWSSSRYKCTLCYNYGAMLSCLQRGCKEEVHVPCARNKNWSLSDENFKSLCDKHCVNVSSTSTTST